jgi:hypothetical protein
MRRKQENALNEKTCSQAPAWEQGQFRVSRPSTERRKDNVPKLELRNEVRRAAFIAFVFILILLAYPYSELSAQVDDSPTARETLQRIRAEEEALRVATLQKLEQLVHIDTFGKPLNKVLETLGSDIGLEFVYDYNPLRDLGIDEEIDECYLVISDVPARAALNFMLNDIGLTWEIRSGRILVTTIDQAQQYLTTRVYNVTDRAVALESGRLLCSDSALIDLFTEIIEPESWDEWGGPGMIECVSINRRILLSVRQTTPVLMEMEQLLGELRRLDVPASERPDPSWVEEDVRVMECLERPLEKSYDNTPLADIVSDMRLAARKQILFDVNPLFDLGIDPEIDEITLDCMTMTVDEALDLILTDIGLTHVLRDGLLLITTIDQAREYLSTRVYDVTNLMGGLQAEGAILDLAEEVVEPESWDSWGGPGSMVLIEQEHGWFLVIRQVWDVHRELEQFLSDLEMRALGDDPYDEAEWQTLLDQVEAQRMERLQRAEELREEAREAEEAAEAEPAPMPSTDSGDDPFNVPNPFEGRDPFASAPSEDVDPPSSTGTDPFSVQPPVNPDPFRNSQPSPPEPGSGNPFGTTPADGNDPFGL